MKFTSVIVVFYAFLCLSCQPIDDCSKEEYTSSIIYSFPDSLPVGTGYELQIHYIIENSCGSFLQFTDTVYDHTTEVKAKLWYEGCNCSLQFEEDSSAYFVQHDSAGIYTYKFLVGATDFDSYTLTVY